MIHDSPLRRTRLACGLVVACALASIIALPEAALAQQQGFQGDPERPWLDEGDRFVGEGEWDEALQAYQRQVEAHGEDAQLWMRLSSVQSAVGRPEEAIESATNARRLAPQDPDPYLMLAQAQITAGRQRQGLATLEEGVAYHADYPPLLEALATVKLGLREWGPAAGLLRQLILLRPEEPLYYLDLGRVHHEVGEFERARDVLLRALELGAPRAPTLAVLGHVELAMGSYGEAREDFEASLADEPNAEAYLGLGGIEFLEHRPVEAAENFRRCLEMAPDDPDAWYNLGNALVLLEEGAEAEVAFRKSIELDPGPASASARLNLGVILLTKLEVEAARETIESARALDSGMPGPYLHLARIAGAQYRYEEAASFYVRYHERIADEEERLRIQDVVAKIESEIAERDAALARGEIHLLQIMMLNEEALRGVRDAVVAGQDFYILAQQHSLIASTAGVDAGFVDPNSLSGDFRAALSGLRVGEMTPVMSGPNGFYVFRRVE